MIAEMDYWKVVMKDGLLESFNGRRGMMDVV